MFYDIDSMILLREEQVKAKRTSKGFVFRKSNQIVAFSMTFTGAIPYPYWDVNFTSHHHVNVFILSVEKGKETVAQENYFLLPNEPS